MKRKIFSCKQIAEIDQYTIQHEPITDIDLMERAASTIARWIIDNISTQHRIICFSGPGNNGGDALAIARLLTENNYHIELYQLDLGKALKGSPAINMKRLKEQGKVKISRLKQGDSLPLLSDNDVILDGMFGSGLVRPLEGLPATIAHHINALGATVIAIDIPSGLFGEDNTQNTPETIVKADVTLTFQFPKLSFFLPGPGEFAGNWIVLSIGLHPKIIEDTDTPFSFIEKDFIAQKLKKRPKFSHKGSYGHALLIAGSYGKMGAAVLAAHACLRAGTGLLTTHVPHMGYQIIQNTVPESMVSIDRSDIIFTEFPDLAQYSAVGIGPGLDTKANSLKALEELLHQCKIPLVIDADGLNLLSKKLALLSKLPPNTILTPTPKSLIVWQAIVRMHTNVCNANANWHRIKTSSLF